MQKHGSDLQKTDGCDRVEIDLDACAPQLRTVNLFPCRPGFDTDERVLYNPYLLYVHSGKGMFQIGSTRHVAESGDLFFCPAGIVQRIQADQEDPFLLTGVDFDLTHHHRDIQLPHSSSPDVFTPSGIPLPEHVLTSPGLPEVVHFPEDSEIRETLLAMLGHHEQRLMHGSALCGGMLKVVLARMLQARQLSGVGVEERRRLSAVLRYLAAHHGPGITCASVARAFHYHPDHLSRLMRMHAGMSLKQYLTGLRIRTALSLLRYSDASLTEIAEKTGFCSLAHFSRVFKEKTGNSPSAYL
jgi:AraC-like DNA-binding protein